MDEMLSVESGDDDALYRIRRADGRVVYVTVVGDGFLPEYERNYGPTVVAKLSELKAWKEPWTTLHIDMGPGEIRCAMDTSPPPAIPQQYLLEQFPLYDLASLSLIRDIKSRTSEVASDGQPYILKIARFPREIEWVTQEIQAYHHLVACPLAPKLVGYVYETCKRRVIGFLTERLEGRFPELGDLEACSKALDELHQYLIHGDLVRYNIIMTPQGPKFIDFEGSVPVGTEHWSASARDEEKQTLRVKLADNSRAGRPW